MKILILLLAALTSACTHVAHKEWEAFDGSKADGTIKLFYEKKLFEEVEIDKQQAINIAKQKCKKWGYKDAEAFGAESSKCTQTDPYWGCLHTEITSNFQCLN